MLKRNKLVRSPRSPALELIRSEKKEYKSRYVWQRAWQLTQDNKIIGENPPNDWIPDLKLVRKIARAFEKEEAIRRSRKQSIIAKCGFDHWYQSEKKELLAILSLCLKEGDSNGISEIEMRLRWLEIEASTKKI